MKAMAMDRNKMISPMTMILVASLLLLASALATSEAVSSGPLVATSKKKNAYATMLYMGTPRDYEFYIAARVMLQTLARFQVDADLVVIASANVPHSWRRTLLCEELTLKNFVNHCNHPCYYLLSDFTAPEHLPFVRNNEGVKVVVVEDISNPYRHQDNFDTRFMFTLNKIYAWRLMEYERVVMLDADNLFLRNPEELFQCGQFCAVFINPCIFHTGLFVLEPSNKTFNIMMDDINNGKNNKDGADQGFLTNHFTNLLDQPLFHPPEDGSRLNGHFRLPLGYQMDASYFYLKLRWSVPCGPNSVITFPSVPMLKPWYWWSWPTLPLGLSWHEKRVATIGYGMETPVLIMEALFFLTTMIITSFIRLRYMSVEKTSPMRSYFSRKPCADHGLICPPLALKFLILVGVGGSFLLPFFIIPTTVHPFIGWGLYLIGSLSLLTVVMSLFQLPVLPVLVPWIGGIGALLVLASPFYRNGISRAFGISIYIGLATPFLWWSLKEISVVVDHSSQREPLMAWTSVRTEPVSDTLMKIC